MRRFIMKTNNEVSLTDKNLDRLAKLFPFSIGMSLEPIGISSKSKEGTEYLTAARNAEEKGLDSLKTIVEALSR